MKLVVGSYWWQPDPGSKFGHPYTPDDVRLLKRMVARHLTVPHEFAVITDRPEAFAEDSDIRAIPIDKTTHVPGTCYVRLMTFHPNGREMIGERFLQMDLDTIIVGNLDHLANREEDLVLWHNPARHPKRPGRALFNTSLLLHRCGSIPGVWDTFLSLEPAQQKYFKDDQWYLSELFDADCPYFDGARDGVYRLAREDTPGSGVSGGLPDNACIVTFPGSEGKPTDSRVLAANPWIVEFRR